MDSEIAGDEVVHIVDDDYDMRDALCSLFASVSMPARCYASASEFLASWDYDLRGCLVLDLRMPDMSGLELQTELTRRDCQLPIVFLSAHDNVYAAVRAMRHGAVDFLIKPVDDELFIETVRNAIRIGQLAQNDRHLREEIQSRIAMLTAREREVMAAVVEGLSSKEIARKLDISYKTVDLHRSHLMAKMQARSVADLVRLCLTVEPELTKTRN